MALMLAEQRKLPGDDVYQITAIGAKPDGSRRSANMQSGCHWADWFFYS